MKRREFLICIVLLLGILSGCVSQPSETTNPPQTTELIQTLEPFESTAPTQPTEPMETTTPIQTMVPTEAPVLTDEDHVVAVAEQFLAAHIQNLYLYTDETFDQFTVLTLNNEQAAEWHQITN